MNKPFVFTFFFFLLYKMTQLFIAMAEKVRVLNIDFFFFFLKLLICFLVINEDAQQVSKLIKGT